MIYTTSIYRSMPKMNLVIFLIAVICKLNIVSSDWTLPNLTMETSTLMTLDESLSECGPFKIDIREITITQIQEYFRTGILNSVMLTQCYLNRISKIDFYLKSVLEVNPEAISLAKQADKERSARLNQSPMHGIPILIKDNIGTADLMQTTSGAIALENLKPKLDAEVVKRLRKAGAVILGKTNLSEWANFRSNGQIPNGWSGRGGQTTSAYVLGQDPSGSSSGSGVSISANLAVISLGTETDGSIISPSARNALVGLKPTLGIVSTSGVIPLAFSNDVVGPMARSVADAAILMGIISDIDLQGCDLDISSCLGNRDFKIGVPRDPYWNAYNPSFEMTISALETCLHILSTTGLASVIDPVTGPAGFSINSQSSSLVFNHEFKFGVNNYLKDDVEPKLNREIYTLADIIQFNEMNPPEEGYGQDTLKMCEATDGLRNKTYLATRHAYKRYSTTYLETIFEENRVDALASPCYSNNPSLYSHGASAGYPSITVPVGIDNTGMPFGLCLLGRPGSEPVLLKLAYLIEISRPTERPVPRFGTLEYLNSLASFQSHLYKKLFCNPFFYFT